MTTNNQTPAAFLISMAGITTTTFDQQLANHIDALRQRAEQIRINLRSNRADCTCGPSGCCAYHAEVNNILADIEDLATRAITYLKDPNS